MTVAWRSGIPDLSIGPPAESQRCLPPLHSNLFWLSDSLRTTINSGWPTACLERILRIAFSISGNVLNDLGMEMAARAQSPLGRHVLALKDGAAQAEVAEKGQHLLGADRRAYLSPWCSIHNRRSCSYPVTVTGTIRSALWYRAKPVRAFDTLKPEGLRFMKNLLFGEAL